jgi:hypothetical protein
MLRAIWFPLVLLLIAGLWLAYRLDPAPLRDHPHEAVHGGTVVSLGRDEYHVEAVFESGGIIRLYTLGRDTTRVVEIEAAEWAAHVLAEGDTTARSLTFAADPQPGDAPGLASRFTARLPDDLIGRPVRVVVPAMRFGRERFRVAFASPDTHDLMMPEKVGGDEERELHLTPGGRYTAADIAANGGKVPSEVYRGFRANHDADPPPGTPVCPVTRTRADPRCTWVIGGERYAFCCPPCIDEFVRLAKTEPDRVRPPGEYVRPER